MIYTSADLLKVILDTRTLSIWDHKRGPVFWYTSNVPGPFYLNTEIMIGAVLAEKMLREITAIVAGTRDAQVRAAQLEKLIMEAYAATPAWQKLIATLVSRAREEFMASAYRMISGGERRDWLFSIPFAHALGLPHLFLFKDKTSHCDHPIKQGQNVLHVSDLINNAASYFDSWQPALSSHGLGCAGNLCVNLRGDNGISRLREAGQKTVALATVDAEFFRLLHAADLIDRATFEEIAIFYASATDWAERYLIGKPDLFNAAGCDAKSFDRLRGFFQADPWKLRPRHEAFFALMQKEIEKRLAQAA